MKSFFNQRGGRIRSNRVSGAKRYTSSSKSLIIPRPRIAGRCVMVIPASLPKIHHKINLRNKETIPYVTAMMAKGFDRKQTP